MLAQMLAEAGHPTGLFTSPHLVSYAERFQINGVRIPESELERLTARLLETAGPEETFFELTTALACCWFADRKVPIAVLEAGMGGRSDATAAVPGIMTIVTPISRDHCQWLGETLPAIADEKIGIAAPGSVVVSAAQEPAVRSVLEQRCRELGCRLLLQERDFSAVATGPGRLSYHGLNALPDLQCGLPGAYQTVNAAVAIAAAEQLTGTGFSILPQAIRDGLAAARWPGRMELIRLPQGPTLLLDGAHNSAGSAALAESLAALHEGPVILLLGLMADKELHGILPPLLARARLVITVSPSPERALDADELAAACVTYGVPAHAASSVSAGLAAACREAREGEMLVAAGSLYLVGELKSLLTGTACEAVQG